MAMSDLDTLIPDRAVRLLRAKVGELEAQVKDGPQPGDDERFIYLAADIALVADLLADHIERTITGKA
jgi:hypothetical protein